MRYTLRNVPDEVDRALRNRARRERRSLNDVVLEALRRGAGLTETPARRRDLSDFVGSWVEDPETDRALEDQRRIDDELWR